MLAAPRFENVKKDMENIVGRGNVFCSEADIMAYSYDSGMDKARPEAVIKFDTAGQIAPAVRLLYEAGIPYIARVCGTNLSGGCIPLKGGAILNLAGLNRILQIDTAGCYAVVEPGVINIKLQNELSKIGYFYAPDPASHKVCSLGGNIGENAGGPRCLKYGVTSNHILEMDIVTAEGKTAHWSVNDGGPDLAGLFVGSEGTFGIAVKIWLKILPEPDCIHTALAAFADMEAAINAVAGIIRAGILPRTLEAMDKMTISAVEAQLHAGYPKNCEAVLLIESDGSKREAGQDIHIAEQICRENSCLSWQTATGTEEREKLWEGRRGAYASMARLAPNVLVEDGAVPRPRLSEALKRVREIAKTHDVRVGLLFHAGDGNLHPNIIFDERNPDETRRVKKAGYEMLKACVALEGTVSGEHGIGVQKRVAMNWLYNADTLNIFRQVKKALDPKLLANPDKIIPVSGEAENKQVLLRPFPKHFSPASTKLADEVKSRFKNSLPSIITGSGTKLPPEAAGRYNKQQELRTDGLSRIIELDKGNYTVTAEAGIGMAILKNELETAGFRLMTPNAKGTLGGFLAAKQWIWTRDLILGLQILLPDGKLLDFGGKTMKNVAGYDIVKLMLGSWGAYGIITAATLRLHSSASRLKIPKTEGAPAVFKPCEYHTRLKKVFDPANLFNPWIFTARDDK